MAVDKRVVLEIVATLSGTGTVMYIAHRLTRQTGFAPLLSALSGVGFLCLLYALDVQGAVYVLAALVCLIALAFLLRIFVET